ncbi:LOW QUALITY PROTEIN: density-regulated protein homolog [Tigriopus californicus]|uniref:LOW QUALITY PROTEIN: density-regulated protein homolog n=1 Tax=Tigriopus californicus TaxID=6832 RepID=UPI0027D9E924|nr:LOW QUALITY PROTEIN: density-regulated protein homolog [Tigriopus californicus]
MSQVTPLPSGPQPGVKYPCIVEYCPNCSMPFEFCEYYPDYEGCRQWLEKHMPEKICHTLGGGRRRAGGGGGVDDGSVVGEDGKKRQTRGGKSMMKAKKKEAAVQKRIILSIAPRGKKKAVTVIQGLKTCGIDLKVASKFFGQKFACGSSITGDDEIVIQGDFKDDLFDVIPEKWPEVDEDLIDDIGEKKRS